MYSIYGTIICSFFMFSGLVANQVARNRSTWTGFKRDNRVTALGFGRGLFPAKASDYLKTLDYVQETRERTKRWDENETDCNRF